MPSSLISAKIRGIRSYSPLEQKCQTIDFMPLTLIVGANGTGKTTVIEALKFIVSGEEPPHSDCRRNFIHTPKREDKKFASGDHGYAVIEIVFKNAFGETCLAKREITRFGTTKSGPPSLSSGYKIGQSSWVYVHRQDDWNKVMPKLFGLPNQAILSNVILCHQEDNLWCMGESASVKSVFDKIFGCEQYKKEIKHIDDEIRTCRKEIAVEEKSLMHLRDDVKRKMSTASQIKTLEEELSKVTADIKCLDGELVTLTERKEKLNLKLRSTEYMSQEIDNLKRRVKDLVDRDSFYKKSLSNLFCVKRAAPVIVRPASITKKQAPDPIVIDLDLIIESFGKMNKLVNEMPVSKELDSLKNIIDETLERIILVKRRFVSDNNQQSTQQPPDTQDDSKQEQEIFERMEKHRKDIEISIEENKNELESLRAKIVSIQEQITNNTEIERTRIELVEVEANIMKSRDSRSMKRGSSQQMQRESDRLERELVSCRDVNVKYAKCLGLLVCNKLIMEDLEKLKKCFQESITNFHEQMIRKINELLRCRWHQIYQGRDIEYIELVAEEITKGKDKKSYNYHMAMRKNGSNMRMREKSSAGQRALASIIVRMTLAELFVRDFAFIALDEPTANLDLANVQALARSIGSYVRKRTKKGANIQWIIITHDEQFLRALDGESSPYFYRIQMDPSDGCSKIIKVSARDAPFTDGQEFNESKI